MERRVQVEITTDVISGAALRPEIGSSRAGAVVTFEGTVRDHHAGKAVAFLEYEAYVPMARSELHRIASEAAERWELDSIVVHHRLGRLEIGEVSVAIAVASAHRAEALDALRWTLERLKESVPIWKRETGPDGTFWIEGPDQLPAAE